MSQTSLRKRSSLQKPARSEQRNLSSPAMISGMGPLRVGNEHGIKGIPSASTGASTRSMFTPQKMFHGLRMRAQQAFGSNTGSRMGQRIQSPPSQPDRVRRRSIPIDSDSRSPLPINTQRARPLGEIWKDILLQIIGDKLEEV